MKLVTINAREVAGRPGILLDDEWIIDLHAAPATLQTTQWLPPSVVSIAAAGGEGRRHVSALIRQVDELSESDRAELIQRGGLLRAAETELMAPIRRPGLVLISPLPDERGSAGDLAYLKNPNSVAGDSSQARCPWLADASLTAQAMIAVVLGRPIAQDADAETAGKAISAWTLLMDLSQPLPPTRDADAWRRYLYSKQFPGACPMGPALVMSRDLADLADLSLSIAVNDITLHEGPVGITGEQVSERLAELARHYAFRPGDVIGFPELPVPDERGLKAGDTVTATAGSLLTLSVKIGGL